MFVKTVVVQDDVKYDRIGYLELIDNMVKFDCSDEEYGPLIFPITLLEHALKEHKLKMEEDSKLK